MSDELKPCPFCGKQPEEALDWVNRRDTNESKRVGWYCLECFEIALENCAVSHLECDRWNSRPIEYALRSKLAIAITALEWIQSMNTWSASSAAKTASDAAKDALAKIRS